MTQTPVLAPIQGRAVALPDVPDPTFAAALVGPGTAIDPPRDVVDAVAPVSGTLIKVFPHAFVIVTTEGVGVLVHLGLDTVQLDGEGFTLLVTEGAEISAGDPVVIYDVPAIEATGRSPITPVIILDKQAEDITLGDAAVPGAEVSLGEILMTVNSPPAD